MCHPKSAFISSYDGHCSGGITVPQYRLSKHFLLFLSVDEKIKRRMCKKTRNLAAMELECLPPFPRHFTVSVQRRSPQRFLSQWSEVRLWTDGWFVGTPPVRASVRSFLLLLFVVHSCSFSSLPPRSLRTIRTSGRCS